MISGRCWQEGNIGIVTEVVSAGAKFASAEAKKKAKKKKAKKAKKAAAGKVAIPTEYIKPEKSKLPLYIGIGAAALLVIFLGVKFTGTRGTQ
jgi:hypothetical protein